MCADAWLSMLINDSVTCVTAGGCTAEIWADGKLHAVGTGVAAEAQQHAHGTAADTGGEQTTSVSSHLDSELQSVGSHLDSELQSVGSHLDSELQVWVATWTVNHKCE